MFNDFELKSITITNGETVAYRECGVGRKILLLIHGNMSSSKHWDLVMDRLQENYKIYAVDMRGFGGSSYHTPINSLKDFAEDIADFTHQIGLEEYVVAGWSTGGGVALELAANYSEHVEKVILIESVGVKGYPMFKKTPTGQPTTERLATKEEISKDSIQVLPVLEASKTKNREFYKMLWNMTIYTKNQPSDEKYKEYIEDMLTQRNLVDVDYALVHFNLTDESNGVAPGSGHAKDVVAPVLILQGDRDLVVPQSMAASIEQWIPNTTYVELPDCGHSPMVDCFERLIEEIIDFIG